MKSKIAYFQWQENMKEKEKVPTLSFTQENNRLQSNKLQNKKNLLANGIKIVL